MVRVTIVAPYPAGLLDAFIIPSLTSMRVSVRVPRVRVR
jgi:hypothetical protein